MNGEEIQGELFRGRIDNGDQERELLRELLRVCKAFYSTEAIEEVLRGLEVEEMEQESGNEIGEESDF